MAYISTADWLRYINRLAAINKKARDEMVAWIGKYGFADTAALVDFAYGLATKYGEGAGALAAEMYDATAQMQSAIYEPAVPAPTATYQEVRKAVLGTAKSQNPDQVGGAVGRLVKRTAADTTLRNAARDGAEFAWVPHGDTCAFCIMLASNGWLPMSGKALKGGHAQHIHANCDCEYAVRFDGQSGIKGYDPDKYLAMYNNAEGNSWQEKVNSMRRAQYAENADRINEQKRAAYAKRRDLKSGNIADKIRQSTQIKLTPVTDESIKNLKVPRIRGFSEEICKKFYAAEKKILETAMQHETGTEVAVICRMDGSFGDPIIGPKGEGTVRVSNPGYDHCIFHNHPDNQVFSEKDIEGFIFRSETKGFVAIGNNGESFFSIFKREDYDGMEAWKGFSVTKQILQDFKNKNDSEGYISAIMQFLGGAEQYGITFEQSGS